MPEIVADDPAGGRFVMAHATGRDCWDTDGAVVRDIVRRWVDVQAAVADSGAVAGLAEFPQSRLLDELPRLLAGPVRLELSADDLDRAWRLVDRLPGLLERIDAAGLPATLVHGDLHPGNLISDGRRNTVIDWGESHRGHPAADIAKLVSWLAPEHRELAATTWVDAWRHHRPDADPAAALEPMKILTHLHDAVSYQRIVDRIEPDEHVYFHGEVADELRLAIKPR